MKITVVSITIFVFLMILIVSCKKDENPVNTGGGGNPTTYLGTFAGASESGSITLTIAGSTIISKATGSVAVAGSLKPVGGAAVSLTGTFNTGTNALAVSGGAAGSTYTLAGTLSGGALSGSYTGPNGNGQFRMESSANNAVKVFVGTYTSQAGNSPGYFNLVQDSTSLSGLAVSVTGTNTDLFGFVAADSIKIYLPGSSTLFLALGRFTNAADTAAAGIYNIPQVDNGVWQCNIAH